MIIPGILENTLDDIQQKINLLENDAKLLQIDIADGIQVDGRSYCDATNLTKLKSKIPLEADLMVFNPTDYLVKLDKPFTRVIAEIGANDIQKFIEEAKIKGFEVGLTINLDTPVADLENYISNLDFVQFRSITAGGQGRPFEPKVLEKIKEFKELHPDFPIQTDGHMDEETIKIVRLLGVENFVVGSAIVKNADPVNKLKELEK